MSLCDYDGRTALHLAAAEGQLPCVEVLQIIIIIIILDTLAVVIVIMCIATTPRRSPVPGRELRGGGGSCGQVAILHNFSQILGAFRQL